MAQLEALLFDVDGTLSNTERDGHRVAFNQAFAAAGLDWQWSVETYGRLLSVTGGKERIRHFLATELPDFRFDGDADEAIAKLHRSKTNFYTELLGSGEIPLRTGVERLLGEAMDAGLRLAIATTTTPANVEALLKNTLGAESLDWFEVIAAGDIVPHKKPAPDIYVWAMEQMNLSPESCLAFEDSENGVRSVIGAGLKSLVVTTNAYTVDHDFSGATLVLDQLGEPDKPGKFLDGVLVPDDCVDLALLHRLHEAAWAAA